MLLRGGIVEDTRNAGVDQKGGFVDREPGEGQEDTQCTYSVNQCVLCAKVTRSAQSTTAVTQGPLPKVWKTFSRV